jgi:NADH-quinone oxidoreductase subunit N
MPTVPVIPAALPPAPEWLFLAPVLFLAFWGLLVLMLDVAVVRYRPLETRARVLGLTALAGAVLALGLAVVLLTPGVLPVDVLASNLSIFNGTLSFDSASAFLQVAALVFLLLVVGLSMTWDFTDALGEYYALLFWSAVGMILLIESEEFLTLFVSLETMTICLYLLTGLERNSRRSSEGALKYFVYGSAATAHFLFGLSWVYGMTGTTRLAAVGDALYESRTVAGIGGQVTAGLALLLMLAGFGFKLAAVPFHQWAPEAYQGAPAPVSGWIASGSKVASIIALMKVLVLGFWTWSGDPGHLESPGWVVLLSIMAAASMTFGNLAALGQRNFKRLLAYSSIAHAGYILVGVVALAVSLRKAEAGGPVLYYLVTYGLATLGGFAVAAWLAHDAGSDEIDDLEGLGRRRPLMAACLTILFLSLIGFPPMAGFMGKLGMFMEVLNAGQKGGVGMSWLVALALINSVISVFYYVRVLKAMYLRPPHNAIGLSLPSGVFWTLTVASVVAVGLGVYPSLLLDPMGGAAISMLSVSKTEPAGPSPTKTEPATPATAQIGDGDRGSARPQSPAEGAGAGGD